MTNYSRLRSQFGENAPVPATFRAHSIETFNKQLGEDGTFVLRWVGREGRQITTPPVDAEMAKTIEAFATTTDRSPRSTLTTIDNRQVLRTVYPSLANEQSCVNCHNQLQADKFQWRLNDVMGAFAIDIPVGAFLQGIKTQSYTVALALFLALAGIGLAISILHFRQLNERESLDDAGADAEHPVQRRAEQHVPGPVHVRRRQAARRVQRALCPPVFAAARAAGARNVA